ncbi:MAG: PKD domain-containing protein [Thermoplasmata archaeon]
MYGAIAATLAVVFLFLAVPTQGFTGASVRHPPAPRPVPVSAAVGASDPRAASAETTQPQGITPGIPPSYSWTNLTVASRPSPPGRYGAAMAYDAADQEVLLFGGLSPVNAQPMGDTWAYSAGSWTELCPGNYGGATCDSGPPPSSDSAMTYTPNGSRIIDYDFARGLTYGFSRGSWVNLSGAIHPPLQPFPSGLAYDPFSGHIVLFSAIGTTWEFSGASWTEMIVPGAHPAPRTGAVLFSDPLLGDVVLTGGVEGSQPLNDTWEYRNHTWREVPTTESPPGAVAAAFDGTYQDGAVLSESPSGHSLVLWGFSANGWGKITEVGTTAPPPTEQPTLAFDEATGYLLLYWGGAVGTPYGLTAPSNTWAAVDAFTGENVSVSRPAVVVGDTFWIHVYAAGGVLPYTYTYAVLPPGCSGSSTRDSVPCPTFEPGTFSIAVAVHDSVYGSSTLFASILVVPLPTASLIGLTNPTTVGRPTPFVGFVSGGLAPQTFHWNFSDGNFSEGANVTHTFGAPGVYTVTLSVINATGVSANASIQEVVNPIVTLVGPHAAPNVTDVGDPISFSAGINGGTAPFGYFWSFGPGQGTGSGPDPNYAYTAAGTYTARVTANDSVGANSTGSVGIVVHPDPLVAILVSVAPFNLTVVLGASIAGGTAPFSFIWSLGDGNVSSNASLAHTYPSAGTYQASVTVRDGAGREVVQSIVLTVAAPLPIPAVAWYNGTTGTFLLLFGLAGVGLGIFTVIGIRLIEEEPEAPPLRKWSEDSDPTGSDRGE